MKVKRSVALLTLLATAGVARAQASTPAAPTTTYPKLTTSIYVDRLSGVRSPGPHYYFLMTVRGSKLHGQLGFEGQDGSTTTVHTFKGHQQFGLATMHFSNHKSLTAEIRSTKKFELENCQAVMHFAESRFPDCQFHAAKHYYS